MAAVLGRDVPLGVRALHPGFALATMHLCWGAGLPDQLTRAALRRMARPAGN